MNIIIKKIVVLVIGLFVFSCQAQNKLAQKSGMES
ncbi:MAG: hypothetical protein RL259_1799, partial [Bacteroidota bacterium]